MSAVLITSLMALTMNDTVAEEPKKEPLKQEDPPKQKPDEGKKESYDLKVTVRQKAGNILLKPVDAVAFRWDAGGKQQLFVWTQGTTLKPVMGSEITETKTGNVWVVTREFPSPTTYICEVKPAEKKP